MTDSASSTKAPALGPVDERLRAGAEPPDPRRLRTACLLVYLGLLLSLFGLFSAPPASAAPFAQRGALPSEWWMFALPAAAAAFLIWRFVARRRRDGQSRKLLDRRTLTLRELNARLDEQARTDASTGIANHRRLRFYLAERWLEARHSRRPLSVIALEIEGIGGLPAATLRDLAASMARPVEHAGGLLARFEGAEFMAVLPDRPPDEAAELAEALQRLLRLGPAAGTDSMSASIGVAGVDPVERDAADRLVHRARNAMRAAKDAGGDRVVVQDHG